MTRLRAARIRGPVRIVALGFAAALTVVFGGTAQAQPTGTIHNSPGTTRDAVGTIRNHGTPAADLVKDQYIVVLKDQAVRADRIGAAATGLVHAYGGTVLHTYDKALHGFSLTVNEAAARRMGADSSVAYVEQVQRLRPSDTQVSPPSWGLDRIDQAYWPTDDRYTYPTVASNVTAYIVDSGIRFSHQDFGGRAVNGFDPFAGTGQDCIGHGTHVAGTVGGTTAGVAKGVRLVSVRVFDCQGNGNTDTVLAGLNYILSDPAAPRPAVANMSLGGVADQALDDAVTNVINAGIPVIAAAGNSNDFTCDFSPARVPAVVTVGAVDRGDLRAEFSNWGTCNDLYAPGVDIVSTTTLNDTALVPMSGTSMAAPHVTGAAALLLAQQPTLTPAQVQKTLVSTTNKSHRILDINGANPPPGPPPAGSWHTASPPAVGTTTRPTVVSNGARQDMFVASSAPGHPVLHATRNGGDWSGWESLGGATVGNPIAAWSSGDRLDLFVTGSDSSIWHQWQDHTGWHVWEPLGGLTKADLVVVSPEPGSLDLFAIGADSGVWHRTFDGYVWGGWDNFGGRTQGHNFSVTVDPANGGERVFVQGGDGAVYYRYFDQAFIYPWQGIGGQVRWDVKAVTTSDGKIDVFAPGGDSTVWHRRWDGSVWLPWDQLGGTTIGGGFEAVAWDAGLVDLFVVGTDDRVWTRHWNNSTWSAWTQLNPSPALTIPRATDLLTYQLTLAFTIVNGPVYAAQWN